MDMVDAARKNRAPLYALTALGAGLLIGVIILRSGSQAGLSMARWIEPIGTMWVNAIRMTVIPLIKGDGPVAEAESMVTFDYFGSVYGADEPFDESYSREPVPFGVGVNGLIKAWDKAIPGLTRGSRVLIIAPPDQAYGDQDRPGIPADSTLVFVVDVLGVDE